MIETLALKGSDPTSQQRFVLCGAPIHGSKAKTLPTYDSERLNGTV
ncbi:hypothetical protein [Rubripirellula lacrimiformis]|nr:hypothetical protein [Rubripirellula lacrimiformis]